RGFTHARELAADALALAVLPEAGCAVVATNDQRLRLFQLSDLAPLGELAIGHEPAELRGSFPDYAELGRIHGGATVRALARHPPGSRWSAATGDGGLLAGTRSDLGQTIAHAAPVVDATTPSAHSKPPSGPKVTASK